MPMDMTRAGAVIGGVVAVAALGLTTAAGAHVTVRPGSVPAGSKDVELAFRVPDERDNASTVGLQVFFPTDLPVLGVNVLPVPGWSWRVETAHLPTPVQTDDGPVSQVVRDVAWSATAGGIGPGQYGEFTVLAGAVPSRAGRVAFKALQTYSSGEVVRWIEVPSSHDPSPSMPAPVLTLTPGTSSVPVGASSSGAGTDDALSIAALVVAVVALGGVAVGLRRSRRARAGQQHRAGGYTA
jgi:uncharacterized protein YcnI